MGLSSLDLGGAVSALSQLLVRRRYQGSGLSPNAYPADHHHRYATDVVGIGASRLAVHTGLSVRTGLSTAHPGGAYLGEYLFDSSTAP